MNARWWLLPGGALVIAALVFILLSFPARVDGRSAVEWLAFAREATTNVAYTASGYSLVDGTPAHYTLEQATGGGYHLHVIRDDGLTADLASDGTHTWCADRMITGGAGTSPAPTGTNGHIRLLGTSTVADRPVVRLAIREGNLLREVALDRETGVLLASNVADNGREVSRTAVSMVDYASEPKSPDPPSGEGDLRPATDADVNQLLGGGALFPGDPPAGFTESGRYLRRCPTCGMEDTVAIRYVGGTRSFTLFEARGAGCCGACTSCVTSQEGVTVLQTRDIGPLRVIAVGDLDPRTLQSVLDSLR